MDKALTKMIAKYVYTWMIKNGLETNDDENWMLAETFLKAFADEFWEALQMNEGRELVHRWLTHKFADGDDRGLEK